MASDLGPHCLLRPACPNTWGKNDIDFRVMQKGYGLFSKALKDICCFLQMAKDIPENVKGIHINGSNT